MRRHNIYKRHNKKGQDGAILIIVMMLVLMFTGLGLLAMRHTRHELKSAGAYMDATQAGALVEGALAMVSTDLRQSADYYQWKYNSTDATSSSTLSFYAQQYEIPLNPGLFNDTVVGTICDFTDNTVPGGCIKELSSPLTGNDAMYGAKVLTSLSHNQPIIGPCPPGFSCSGDQNYTWYIFTVNATATYGPNDGAAVDLAAGYNEDDLFGRGRAQGRGRLTVGPIATYGK